MRSVAFVVPSDVTWTMPLYDVAIATARGGWRIGIADVRYWFVTPEPVPLAGCGAAATAAAGERLGPEGISFIGSTYPDVRRGVVLLDPQGESIAVDVVVSLGHGGNLVQLFTSQMLPAVDPGRVPSLPARGAGAFGLVPSRG